MTIQTSQILITVLYKKCNKKSSISLDLKYKSYFDLLSS